MIRITYVKTENPEGTAWVDFVTFIMQSTGGPDVVIY